jgi:hypothetical protein
MSDWSSEAVNQKRDNIITKGKNDKTIKWSTTDYRNTFCIRLFFFFSVLASSSVIIFKLLSLDISILNVVIVSE